MAVVSRRARAAKAITYRSDFGSDFNSWGSVWATATWGWLGVLVFAPATARAGGSSLVWGGGTTAAKRGLFWVGAGGGVLVLPCNGGTGTGPGASVSGLFSRSLGLRSSSYALSCGGSSAGGTGAGPKPGRGVMVCGSSIIGSQASSMPSLSVSWPPSGTTTQELSFSALFTNTVLNKSVSSPLEFLPIKWRV